MKILRLILSRSGLVICGVYVLLGSLSQCASMGTSKKSVEQKFEGRELKPTFHEYDIQGRTLFYSKIGNDSLPLVLFVHGSPGGWNAYEGYFLDTALTNKALLVSVDRPGYGGSGKGWGEPSLEMQAAMLRPLLELSTSDKKPVLIGHSLGGPIIARMAMDYPNEVGSLIFLAPSIDPGMEKYEWYRPFFKTGIMQAILPKEIQASNEELMPLKKELYKMLPMWKNITLPCTIIHGTSDMLVPYGNVDFYERMLVNAPQKEVVKLENVNHFIPWTHYDTVKGKILEHLEK